MTSRKRHDRLPARSITSKNSSRSSAVHSWSMRSGRVANQLEQLVRRRRMPTSRATRRASSRPSSGRTGPGRRNLSLDDDGTGSTGGNSEGEPCRRPLARNRRDPELEQRRGHERGRQHHEEQRRVEVVAQHAGWSPIVAKISPTSPRGSIPRPMSSLSPGAPTRRRGDELADHRDDEQHRGVAAAP